MFKSSISLLGDKFHIQTESGVTGVQVVQDLEFKQFYVDKIEAETRYGYSFTR